MFYSAQAGCPQSQAISTSPDPASLQNWLQYFSPSGARKHKANARTSLPQHSCNPLPNHTSSHGRSIEGTTALPNQVFAVYRADQNDERPRFKFRLSVTLTGFTVCCKTRSRVAQLKTRFRVAQRFQRCDEFFLFRKALALELRRSMENFLPSLAPPTAYSSVGLILPLLK